MNEVRVNRKAASRVASGHPWIFASDVIDRDGAQPGEPVRVVDQRGHLLGTAHYSSTSQITLRLLSRQAEPIDREFFLKRLRAAEDHRKLTVHYSEAYRVVHGEGDLLPALVVDRYGDYLVMQTLDQGMDAAKQEIASCLQEIFRPCGILARNDVAVRSKEELPLETEVLMGEVPEAVPVRMNHLRLCADLLQGQKTGIFPPHHTTIIRESVVREHPWVARSLMEAFDKAKALAMERVHRQPPTLLVFGASWLRLIDQTFGKDPFVYGVGANARAIDMVQTFSVEQGLSERKQPWEELFPEEILIMEERLPGS